MGTRMHLNILYYRRGKYETKPRQIDKQTWNKFIKNSTAKHDGYPVYRRTIRKNKFK